MSCHSHGATSYHTHTSLLSHRQKEGANVWQNFSMQGLGSRVRCFRTKALSQYLENMHAILMWPTT